MSHHRPVPMGRHSSSCSSSTSKTPSSPTPLPSVAAVESKRAVLLDSLARFYDEPANFQQFSRVVRNEIGISLRTLDWLVTNYAKKRNLFLVDKGRPFNVFLEYKSQLKGYSKRFFDPFCRRERTEFRGLDTTLGQLNFFRWAILNGVLDYGIAHEADIEADMMDAIRQRVESSAAVSARLVVRDGAAMATTGIKKEAKEEEISSSSSSSPPKHGVRKEVFTKTHVLTTLHFE